jgi:DNA-binding FadR family transcriptional regulator
LRNLHAQALHALGLAIVRGDYAPGTIMPTEAALSRQFGVSRSIVREAVKSLAAKGLVESRARIGTRVRDARDWNLLDRDVLGWHFAALPRRRFFNDLFEIRRVFEPAAAALAAEKADAADIDALEKAVVAMETASSDSDAAIDADVAFHRTILAACRNPLILQMGSLISIGLWTSFQISDRSYDASLPFHRPIFAAIRDREPARARAAMETLLAKTLDFIGTTMRYGEPGS